MEHKTKKLVPKRTVKKRSKGEKFQLNLKTLDGYDLPNLDKSDSTEEPQAKKSKQVKPQVLGVDYRELEEKRLEQLLFGNLVEKFQNEEQLNVTTNSNVELSEKQETKKQNKKKKKKQVKNNDVPEDVFGKNLGTLSTEGKKQAWVDEDDEDLKVEDVKANGTVYKKVLEKNYVSVHGQLTPKWAQLNQKKKSESDNEDDVPDLTKTAAELLSKSITLPHTVLKYLRIKDINKECRAEGIIINSLEFHKKQNVALVAGNSGVASLYQVGGQANTKIQSITFKKFPIHKACFSADGEEIFATSQTTGDVQIYNLTSGKNITIPHNRQLEKQPYCRFNLSPDGRFAAFQGRFGYIHLMSARTKEWITSFKMNGEVKSLTFNSDGSKMYSHGNFGEVYVWDMKARRCVHKFVDEGCIEGMSIAISPSQQYLACGSSSGVVNIYNTSSLENNSTPKPEKAVLNLVTRVTGIDFHPSSELMAIHSHSKESAIKLVHFPSMTVFKNFPTTKDSKGQIFSLDFSPNGGYMGIGFSTGSAKLFRLQHYDQY